MHAIKSRVLHRDSGAALPIVAVMLFVLLGIAAFATDLGWFYLNISRVQRTADAGALSGVVWMPDDFPRATSTARAVAQTNGYQHASGDVDVAVSQVIGEPAQLHVTVTDVVPTFFLKVFGFNQQTISRAARAEYVPPLPLGSPAGQFGNACDPREPGCTGQPNFWANIHGRYTSKVMGDAYSSYCDSQSGSGSCTPSDVPWRERGYLYGIEANGAGSFTVSIMDGAFHNKSGTFPNGDPVRTGDHNRFCGDSDAPTASSGTHNAANCLGPSTTFRLYGPDPDPLDISNNSELCTYTYEPEPQVAGTDPYVWDSPAACFTVAGATSGVYVLQVVIEPPAHARRNSGLNRYALKVDSPSRLYGLGDISIYNNATGTTTEFDLAEVQELYRGKTLVVELFDPGEGASGNLEMIAPDGAPFDDGACRIYSRNDTTVAWTLQSTPASCIEFVGVNEYNDRWLKFEMDLPAGYSCGADCWWKVNYDYTSGIPNDTTTWRAYIEGNPIHLVPTG